MMQTFLILLVWAGGLAASNVGGPVLGLVETAPNEFRVLRGGPGSMELAEAVALPEGVTRAVAAPRQEWLLVERNGTLEAFDWQRGRTIALGAAGGRVSFSPSGRELAVYSEETARLVVWSGLPERSTVLRDEKRGELGEGVRALAVSDGGPLVVAHSGGRLLRLDASGAAVWHASDDIAALAFIPESRVLLAADRIQNAVLRIDEGGTSALLSAADGLDEADAVWAGSGGRLAVGSFGRGQIWLYDGAEWRVENVEGLAAIHETRLRDTLLLGERAVVSWGNAEQRVYALPGRRP